MGGKRFNHPRPAVAGGHRGVGAARARREREGWDVSRAATVEEFLQNDGQQNNFWKISLYSYKELPIIMLLIILL